MSDKNNNESNATAMSRDDVAEQLLELIYFFSAKRGVPNWPILPFAKNTGILFDAMIPAKADMSILTTPIILASDWLEGPRTISNIVITRATIAQPKITRNYLRYVEPGSHIVHLEWYDLNQKEAQHMGAFLVGKQRGQYVPLGPVSSRRVISSTGSSWHENGGSIALEWARVVPIYSGVRLMMDASWVARLRIIDNGPAVELPTNPEGMYALFKDRNTGGDRRKKLLHWVRNHCRVTRNGSTTVTEHLRGVHKFDWHGTNVLITPPADSLERALISGKVPPSVVKAVERYRKMVEEYDNDPPLDENIPGE